MLRSLRLGMLLCAVLLMSGCTVRVADFTFSSTKNSTFPVKSLGKRVTGENCVFSVWLVHFNEPNVKEAFDRALEQAGPEFDALADVVVLQKIGIFSNCLRVQGTAISTKGSRI